MLSAALEKLLAISSEPLCLDAPQTLTAEPAGSERLVELTEMLGAKNGFYALGSALHVFPSCESAAGRTLAEWNKPSLWKSEYGNVLDGCFCFAEDIFGEQFCLHGREVFRFDPEQATLEPIAASLSDWAEKILANYNYETGYEVAHGWQTAHGNLEVGKRLVPT